MTGETLELTPDQLLTTTRAVRRRLDLSRPVERAVIERCLEIAFQAPSGENTQSWGWIAVDDPAIRARMAEIYRAGVDVFMKESAEAEACGTQSPLDRMGMKIRDPVTTERVMNSMWYLLERLEKVPVLVVPLLRTRFENRNLFETASIWGSVMPAAWNFMLALRSRGLGSTWTTGHLLAEKEMATLLGVPDDSTQVGMFPVAYTIGTDFKPAKRDPLREVLSWNHWDH